MSLFQTSIKYVVDQVGGALNKGMFMPEDFFDLVYQEDSASRMLAKMCNLQLAEFKEQWLIEGRAVDYASVKQDVIAELKADSVAIMKIHGYPEHSWMIDDGGYRTKMVTHRALIPKAFIEELPKCLCGEINARHCPVHSVTECKHEPNSFKTRLYDKEIICEECGVKLKATWSIAE